MKNIVFLIFLFVSISIYGSGPLKIGVITDTHYLSEQLITSGLALDRYVLASGKNVQDAPAVLDKVLDDYLYSDIEVLLVCGDITKDGEKQSHLDFLEKLKPLQKKGVNVFVIPGNHDINMPNAIGFKAENTYPVANVSPHEFVDLYAQCGYNTAMSRDTASLSYVAKLNDKTWLLAIDAAKYKEYTTRSISSGRISPRTEKWIVDVLDDARSKGIQVVGMMHWGLVEHLMYQSVMFRDYLVDDWKRLANLFADKGMKAIFTGHFHANDITSFVSDKGKTIYDIETGTLAAYPFSYRFVELTPKYADIKTKNIVSIPSNPDLAEKGKQQLLILFRRLASQKLDRLAMGMPDNISTQFANIMAQIFVLHAYGDEVVEGDLKQSIDNLSRIMGSPIDVLEKNIDFPPADNNVKILF